MLVPPKNSYWSVVYDLVQVYVQTGPFLDQLIAIFNNPKNLNQSIWQIRIVLATKTAIFGFQIWFL